MSETLSDNEINEAVARKLAYGPMLVNIEMGKTLGIGTTKDYCHSIEAAWEVVESLAKRYFGVSVSHDNLRDLWQCAIETIKEPGQYETADTAPMAICLAFLKLP